MNFAVVSAAPTAEEGKTYHAIGKPEETLVIIVFPCRLGIYSKRQIIVTKVEPLDPELKYFRNFGVLICDFGNFLIGKACRKNYKSFQSEISVKTKKFCHRKLQTNL